MAAFMAALQFGPAFGISRDAMFASAKARLDRSPWYWHKCCVHVLELLDIVPQVMQHQHSSCPRSCSRTAIKGKLVMTAMNVTWTVMLTAKSWEISRIGLQDVCTSAGRG